MERPRGQAREGAQGFERGLAQLLGRGPRAAAAGCGPAEGADGVELKLADAVEGERERLGGLAQGQRLGLA